MALMAVEDVTILSPLKVSLSKCRSTLSSLMSYSLPWKECRSLRAQFIDKRLTWRFCYGSSSPTGKCKSHCKTGEKPKGQSVKLSWNTLFWPSSAARGSRPGGLARGSCQWYISSHNWTLAVWLVQPKCPVHRKVEINMIQPLLVPGSWFSSTASQQKLWGSRRWPQSMLVCSRPWRSKRVKYSSGLGSFRGRRWLSGNAESTLHRLRTQGLLVEPCTQI